jgi:hypothetical protein
MQGPKPKLVAQCKSADPGQCGNPPNRAEKTLKKSKTSAKKLPAECKITGDVFGDNPAVKGGIKKKGVYATYHYYAPGYETSSLACADIFHSWKDYGPTLLKYPWSAWCLEGSAGWNPKKTCGKCFRIRNQKTRQAVIIRAVDSGGCSGGAKNGLDLDPCAFRAIDAGSAGIRDGHLMVDVEEVEC